MDSSEKSACPICFREFPFSEIDLHVNKCLFLNVEESNPSTSHKRSATSPDEDSSSKKQKFSSQTNKSGQSPLSFKKRESLEGNVKSATKSQDEVPIKQETQKLASLKNSIPLAEQMRPAELDGYVGQDHVLGANKVLRLLLDKHEIPSMILWGPPGCGKTTLAHIIANQSKDRSKSVRFVKLSATSSGVNDVKEIVKVAKNELQSFKRRTILFMDEIHRFNKLQQDIFLPHVESGTITLIGATTENPSFSLNSALLSRCRVIVLEKLQPDQMSTILERAVLALGGVVENIKTDDSISSDHSEEEPRISIDQASIQWLAEMCDGDARIALNSLHMALQAQQEDLESSEPVHITLEDIKDGIKRSHLLYDKKGDEHYNIISAVHKSIRASDDNAALYWVTRMLEGGEDPVFIGRRLVRAAAEDIGLADPQALPLAVAAMQGCQLLGMPECDVLLAQCAVYLARAPKSQEVYRALLAAKSNIKQSNGPLPGVPLHLRNTTSKLVKDLGWGKDYNMRHKDYSGLIYMPEGMEKVNFFQPKPK